MKQTRILMGMPITISFDDQVLSKDIFKKVFEYFKYIDNKFSTYKKTSEITKINNNLLQKNKYSKDMKYILRLCQKTKKQTNGYFDAYRNGYCDPSGIVKGWAILEAARLIKKDGYKNFYVEAGGDIQVYGKKNRQKWKIGIKNPFNQSEIIKTLLITNKGVATSGTYIRGQHIYNPKNDNNIEKIVSLTVIGKNIYEADRFATAAFAMGIKGIEFIERIRDLEGYMIDNKGIAVITSGFKKYV